jgi:hypothetical protein
MANHRARTPNRAWWRMIGARLCHPPKAPISAQRLPGIELVDARTRVAHQVSADVLLAGRARGEYEALCGVRLLAASLTEPGHDWCQLCREQVAPTACVSRSAVLRRGGAR